MQYSANRLIVDGIDLEEKFKMVLLDGYTLAPPSPKTYTVDIPGGNGKLDLTETLLGDIAFGERTQSFEFAIQEENSISSEMTKAINFLHGRAYDYQMTMDPGYTYHGRFSVESYTRQAYANTTLGKIKVKVTAKPFKHKQILPYKCFPVGGKIYEFDSGRESFKPTIDTDGFLRVIFDGKQFELQQGTWEINDVVFKEGKNYLYLCSYDIRGLSWKDLITKNVTWGQFGQKKLFEWYKENGSSNLELATWEDYKRKTWSEMSDKTWNDIQFINREVDIISNTYVSYEWGDL